MKQYLSFYFDKGKSMSLGENIKMYRECKMMSLADFSSKTGIALDACQAIETGKRALSSTEIQTICRVLDVTFESLVTPPPAPSISCTEGSVLMPVDELQSLLGKMRDNS